MGLHLQPQLKLKLYPRSTVQFTKDGHRLLRISVVICTQLALCEAYIRVPNRVFTKNDTIFCALPIESAYR